MPRRLARWISAEPDWDSVYAEQLPRVYNFFRYRFGDTADAEDLTSRTFEKAWRARARYRRDVAAFSPSDSLWRLGAYYVQPMAVRDLQGPSPFTSASVPNALMVWWAAGMTMLILMWVIRQFSRRAL